MKKQLLIGSALFAAISVFPQNGRIKPTGAMLNPSAKLDVINENYSGKMKSSTTKTEDHSTEKPSSATAISWAPIANSMNIYGMVIATAKPLQYNDNLNAVSFIHRKGPQYTAAPVSNSGAILMRYSTNWGTSWDSTCIYSDGTNLARYPSGALYNQPPNTNIINAFAVGGGPATGGSGWVGAWYASKQLGSLYNNNTASTLPLAQQFMSNSAPFGTIGRSDDRIAPVLATDDGKIHALGVVTDYSANTNDTAVNIITGTFNSGVFNWSGNKISPPFMTTTTGDYAWFGRPIQAWNEAGTVGYLVCIGGQQGAVNNNRGWQPIVYKTTNSGVSWSQIANIDFNNAAYNAIINTLSPTNADTNVAIPQFGIASENVDAIVDGNNKLHIFATINSASSGHQDSLGYRATYYTGFSYTWLHKPGLRPYLYDFMTDGTSGWNYLKVDSMSSEGVGQASTDPGYNDNPWDADPANANAKVRYGARLQMSRTPDGQHIVYTWAESDTNFTNGAVKFNALPNVKARAYSVALNKVSTNEINITKNVPLYSNVANRAMFHNIAPTSSTAQVVPSGSLSISSLTLPITVSNSNPYSQLTVNTHYYSAAPLTFTFNNGPVGVKDNGTGSLSDNFLIYPNPTKNSSVLAMELSQNAVVYVNICNTIGQVVKTVKAEGTVGQNTIHLDLEGLSSGIYLVTIKAGNVSGTKKLVIQ